MYSRNILELHLRRIELNIPGVETKTGTRALILSLIVPRPTIAERSHSRIVTLTDGTCDLATAQFHESIVFKETVQGPFAIRAMLSDRGEPSSVEEWLRQIGDYALRATGAYFSADMPTFLRTLAQQPFAIAGSEIVKTTTPIQLFATAETSIPSSEKSSHSTIEIPLKLVAATTFTTPTSGPRKPSRPGSRRSHPAGSLSHPKDTIVGTVRVSFVIV